jgi:adenylate cyclase
MFARLDELNRGLAGDLAAPLRMGIGIHVGPAVVGEIGYGRSRSLTAVGDTVNIASRLETLSKSLGCELVLSEDLLRSAGLDLPDAPRHETEIRGRTAPIAIRTLARVDELAATVPTTAAQPAVAATGWAHFLFARPAS